jgi:hypothetical protein
MLPWEYIFEVRKTLSNAQSSKKQSGRSRFAGRFDALRLIALGVLAGAGLALAPAAEGHAATSQTLDVNFAVDGTVSVSLPDGTPVGTTSGAPTVIPAGYYAVVVLGPGGCTQLPLFDLKGPGETIVDDMGGGEVTSQTYSAYFMPNSTYTWRTDNVNPAIVHTFVTSAVVGGTPLVSGATVPAASPGTTVPTSQDLVGSAIVPFRGKLTAAVSPTGVLTLLYRGRQVTNLLAGRYTVTITDESATHGFMLEKASRQAVSLTGAGFVGKRSTSIDLTAGHWLALSRSGTKAYSIAVAAGSA